MRWYWPLFGVSAVLLIVGAILSDRFPPLLLLGPGVWLLSGASLLCPRCKTHLLTTRHSYSAPWIKVPDDCVRCGRSRKDVWPFQWLLRPERGVAE